MKKINKFLFVLILLNAISANVFSQSSTQIKVFSEPRLTGGLFLPTYDTISVGDTIIWTPANAVLYSHTITTKKFPAGAAPVNFQFKLPSDTIFKYIVTKAGDYIFECTPHSPYMFGNITVTEPNGVMPKDIQYTTLETGPQLAPNPAQDVITLYNLEENIIYKVKIYNEAGHEVYNQVVTSKREFPLQIADYKSGIYNIHLAFCGCKPQKNGCGGAGKTLKFIKQ